MIAEGILNYLAQRFELSRGVGGDHVRSMEGLRGLAVFLVFLVHYVSLVEPWIIKGSSVLTLATALHRMGNSGVDLFFVLSGFLIYGSLLVKKQAYFRFMRRRIERIYPTFTVVFLVYVLLSFALPGQSKIPAGVPQAALYLVENFLLLPGLFPITPMITVAWSLSYELFYYLAIPFVIAAFSLRKRSSLWRMTFFLILSGLLAVYCAFNGGHIRLIMFVSGIMLFEVMNGVGKSCRPASVIGLLALALGLSATLLPVSGSAGVVVKIGILSVTFFVLCLTCFRNSSGRLAQAFCWTPLRYLGNMSYSYYLVHGLALQFSFLVLARALPGASFGAWFFWVALPAMFLLTLLASGGLFLLVERPFSLGTTKARPSAQHVALAS